MLKCRSSAIFRYLVPYLRNSAVPLSAGGLIPGPDIGGDTLAPSGRVRAPGLPGSERAKDAVRTGTKVKEERHTAEQPGEAARTLSARSASARPLVPRRRFFSVPAVTASAGDSRKHGKRLSTTRQRGRPPRGPPHFFCRHAGPNPRYLHQNCRLCRRRTVHSWPPPMLSHDRVAALLLS